MQTKHQGNLSLTILIAFVVGALAGGFGAFFIQPYLEKYSWGQQFLYGNEINTINRNYKATEESATIDVVKKVSPSVVSIVVSKGLTVNYNLTGPDAYDSWDYSDPLNNADETKKQIGGGTGFVIDSSGLILTNKHVLADTEASYSVVFNDGTQYEAQVLGRDVVSDIGILKINATDLPEVELGDSSDLQIGQTVIAIGNALSEYQNTVTRGVVSGINRSVVAGNAMSTESIDGAIQTDAAINPGNSGGPLLNLAGQVVGINTAVNWQGQSLGFAIPINEAKSVIESVKEFGEIVRPWLGVYYVQIDESLAEKNNLPFEYGALIATDSENEAVMVDSPAEQAGLKKGDIILEVQGVQLKGQKTLINEIAKYQPNDEIILKVYSENEEKMINIILAKRQM